MIVYWAPALNFSTQEQHQFYLNIKEPKPVIQRIKELHLSIDEANRDKNNFLKCPSVINNLKNTYAITSPINLTYSCDGETFNTHNFNQRFFDEYVFIRDTKSSFVSLKCFMYVFFSEESLELELLPAYLENSDFANSSVIIPGSFNISKWFRNLDLSFFIKENYINKKINIMENDSLCYVKFNHDEKIEFKKFFLTKELFDMISLILYQKNYKYNKNLKNYLTDIYNLFEQSKSKKYILKKIKENLME